MRISIKHLLVTIAFLSISLTLASSLYAGYKADQETLKEITLETNLAYAQKLAKITEDYLLRTERILSYSASNLSGDVLEDNVEHLNKEAERLVGQSESLSSVVITNRRGRILGASSAIQELVGNPITDANGQLPLISAVPEISTPYQSQTGKLIVFISTPIHDRSGNVIGLIGGSIYLEEENVLNNLLGQHFYEDGSYVYVIDSKGMIMYHIDRSRVGEVVEGNPVIDALKKGESGSMQLFNTKNVDMLAGYASIPLTNWGVVTQRPTEIALATSKHVVFEMIVKSLPFILLSAILIIIFTSRIAKPLERLADYATDRNIHAPMESGAWYHEAIELDRALSDSFIRFQNEVDYFITESTTDPLTRLLNRRALNERAHILVEQNVSFSLVILDIDRFKRVNDTFGHSMGDEVLKFLAQQIKKEIGDLGTCYRFGGEEFVILLPITSVELATDIVNKLRITVAEKESPVGESITFSAGIAEMPRHSQHLLRLIEIADECLYEAKETGRNRVVNANKRNVTI
ncbi:sensor domain-containing diguanylate cyclase [Sporosarcina aquimarina]|uniref:Sensor domain-containing diguanylate cyclase n=1 Tax=Sporosarcina aquimarina TaxID=114975 RepID=A0ABU4FY28_9BACL|nr:sensor domain-containing diguanylate cyclase [Sporosarcina aquimarina]MDW0109556.1 sensor domain-containing diguanylate cyclase [Sporosarcina aquimarina]